MRAAMHFWVTGKVQGVYFRASTKAKAEALGLSGWVKNLPEGQVEGVACGDRTALDELKAWLAKGPESAQVTHLEVRSEAAQNWLGFKVK